MCLVLLEMTDEVTANRSARPAIRARNTEDDEEIIRFCNRAEPDAPPRTLSSWRANLAAWPRSAVQELWVATLNGRTVGLGEIRETWYLQTANTCALRVVVDPSHRDKGVGCTLYQHLENRCDRLGVCCAYVDVRKDDTRSRDFAHRRGFAETGYGKQMSRLDLSRIEVPVPSGREMPAPADIHIVSLAELGDSDAILRAVWALDEDTARDMPDAEEWRGASFEQWKDMVLGDPAVSPETIWLACRSERMVGLTVLEKCGPIAAATGYTGVRRGQRGRGIATALKSRAIDWARGRKIRYLYAVNDTNNAAMLAVNRRLRYEELPASVKMKKHFPARTGEGQAAMKRHHKRTQTEVESREGRTSRPIR